MDDPRRTLSSSTTSTTVVSDDTTNGRPPPLPLSTSSFAFDRPSLSEELSPGEDASSIAFIHQPNPDYGGGDDETVSPSSTSSSSSSSAETLTQTADISIADVVTGEILAADSNTAETPVDWGHHTQVYGGGVCLACLAAESSGGRGGEYGASVPMEDRR
ncbi:hypothetical protein Sste5346_006136 [Sporothrix stenoceras]|uniref:Uncharacterized protein n=1 Tax=Sporothrix stenoceras TaxID=5173 RepID=A0ABR3Z034_9PEZI